MRRSISCLYPQGSALLVLTASLACSCVTAFAGEVGLAWDAKTEPEIVGYKIYYGVVSTGEVRSIDVGNVTSYKVNGLSPDTYYFCVTAYDFSGRESPCSDAVSISIPRPMYGDGGSSLEPKDAFQPGLYSRYVSENHRSVHSGREIFLGEWHSSRRLVRDKDRYDTEDMAFLRTWPASGPAALHQKSKLWRL